MRLLHPKTLEIVAYRDDLPKTIISHAWAEVFKWKASGQKHPKCFIKDDYLLGVYLNLVYRFATKKGCDLDKNKIDSLGLEVKRGFCYDEDTSWHKSPTFKLMEYFDDNYLFSDACSLYYKGHNIFTDIFEDDWRKYIPVESHKEIIRQCNKKINDLSSN